MIERTTEQRFLAREDHQAGLWYTIQITPARARLMERWAQHLGLSRAALAARLFTEGSIQLALDDIGGTAQSIDAVAHAELAEAVLADLERYLDARRTEGGAASEAEPP